MSITLQINPALEQQLRERAAQKGVGVERYVQSLLEKISSTEIEELPAPKLSQRESDLLQKISLGLSPDFWERYRALMTTKESRLLTETERVTFIKMTDQIEAANAGRMKYLIELAQLRQIPLLQLMTQLGIKGGNYA
ncbi:MAG: hypothetical protein H7246_17330 [Phycisphaerae bacterium]|nr:hypothetical protein [Saprospiraceae bacterium]